MSIGRAGGSRRRTRARAKRWRLCDLSCAHPGHQGYSGTPAFRQCRGEMHVGQEGNVGDLTGLPAMRDGFPPSEPSRRFDLSTGRRYIPGLSDEQSRKGRSDGISQSARDVASAGPARTDRADRRRGDHRHRRRLCGARLPALDRRGRVGRFRRRGRGAASRRRPLALVAATSKISFV